MQQVLCKCLVGFALPIAWSVDLCHELAVRGPCGGEVLVSFLESQT